MQRLIATRLAIFGQSSSDQLSTCLPSLCTRQMHTSITLLYSSAADGKGGQPSDPFTQQLQDKTERELTDLVAAAARKNTAAADSESDDEKTELSPARNDEIGGPKGKEPTRYGDWEKGGRCTDF